MHHIASLILTYHAVSYRIYMSARNFELSAEKKNCNVLNFGIRRNICMPRILTWLLIVQFNDENVKSMSWSGSDVTPPTDNFFLFVPSTHYFKIFHFRKLKIISCKINLFMLYDSGNCNTSWFQIAPGRK